MSWSRRELLRGLLSAPAIVTWSALPACRTADPSGRGSERRLPPLSRATTLARAPVPMTLLVGEYRVVGAQPDGDSVRFRPHEPDDWRLIPGAGVRTNRLGAAQLRLDGIDALETHYTPPRGGLGALHQPLDLAHAAADRLLTFLGFQQVTRDARQTVRGAVPATCPGYVLTRQVDRYGRCVALAFPGPAPGRSGQQLFVGPTELRASASHLLAREGLVYPTFYASLPTDLRLELQAVVRAARAARRGVWARDVTNQGFTLRALEDLSTRGYLLPKLYRRLIDHVADNGGDVSLAALPAALVARNERLLLPQEASRAHFASLVEVDGQTVRLTRPPEDLVFDDND